MVSDVPVIKLNHVNHVVYLTRDPKRSMEFYHDFLGIKQIPKMQDIPTVTWLQLPSGVMLHLMETDNAPTPQENHIAFEVEDYDTAVAAVKAKGITIIMDGVRLDGQRYFFIEDPDGNRVELCTPSGF